MLGLGKHVLAKLLGGRLVSAGLWLLLVLRLT